MNKICKTYISEVKTLFPVKGKNERAFIKKLSSDIESYCEETGIATKQELYENYGTPTDILNNYYSAVETDYIVKKVRLSKYIKTLVVAIIVAAVVASSTFCIILYQQYQILTRQEAVFREDTIVEITE